MEHCGDDFLAALAESMQNTEDWDDLRAYESEACGALNDMFSKDMYSIGEQGNQENIGDDVYIIEDSPEPKKNSAFMEVGSSTDVGATLRFWLKGCPLTILLRFFINILQGLWYAVEWFVNSIPYPL